MSNVNSVEQAKDQIRKLVFTTFDDGAYPNEVEFARKRIGILLKKYNLSLDMVYNIGISPIPTSTTDTYTKDRLTIYRLKAAIKSLLILAVPLLSGFIGKMSENHKLENLSDGIFVIIVFFDVFMLVTLGIYFGFKRIFERIKDTKTGYWLSRIGAVLAYIYRF